MIPQTIKKTCSLCGRENRQNAKFCIGCGSSLRNNGNGSNSNDTNPMISADSAVKAGNNAVSDGTIVLKGRFHLREKIYSDNYGEVFRAYDKKKERYVIMKIDREFPADLETSYLSRKRFADEGERMSRLEHKYIPRVITSYFKDGNYVVVMKMVKGKSIEDLVKNGLSHGNSIPAPSAIKIIISLCDLITYLHNFKPTIIHRNIKPSKVMISSSRKVLLLPWVPRPCRESALLGTKGYAAPEQYKGKYDLRSDVYGLGAVLYYLLSGKEPGADAPFHFIPISILRPDLRGELEMVITKALQLNPGDRFRSVGELKSSLLMASKHYFR
ncbi:MAG: protein kinase [Candidatus Eremiobacteraeota bacterium]|nr:protein kinase [Candidatus Eremiobacteraeota bacterium]